jgi:cytochrome c oxidase subunit 2
MQMGGNSVITAPRLSGMDKAYIERQLQGFKKGWRGVHPDDTGGQEMRPMAAVLSDKDIVEVAKYVSAVDSAAPAVTVAGDADRGKTLYQSCVACHGAEGQGNPALQGPALTGLNDWYVVTQLQNYKAGVRGSHPDDTYGQQMQSATALLSDQQAMQDVARYIGTMNSN